MPERNWDALAKKIEPRWGPERAHSVRAAIQHRGTKRRRAIGVGASVVALALVAAGAVEFARSRIQAPTASLPSAALQSNEVATVTVVHLTPDTIVEAMPAGDGRGFVVRSGGARFMSRHDAEHPFVVVAGDISIEDLGTIFTVQFLSADKVDVAVEEGRVKVRSRGKDTEIAAGGRLAFTLAPSPSAAEPADRPLASSTPSSWRPLAESGRYDEAHTALKKAGPNAVRDETADLLLAADAARLSGHPSDAVPYLERVVRAHASDPRSSLAAFTLGRVLLDELGRPRESADAFARARAAGGPLAEDALAREVEAASRSGDTTRSRDLAREYQKLYPKGRRGKAVSRFGGLD